ncbi:glycoside hydrolase family 31 protein [Flavihumibacter sp. CACIAM 22H1]|uniref:glycoside hydrolase family 31 protein n=1 Tax=Flavihumibacter sp. CACIAM 22H1 TaxID=1812911 RepID=UPI0007A855BD|nr:glycoside hydrolase family 31 protein [Flavihumibacter sp. CACIAM 22H1]KYP14062.1 MAG: glycosyl hydrolase family 31 [Flavihumibacter sp. CACIAM 22H1]
MKKICKLIIGLLISGAGNAQPVKTPGNCIGYEVKGNTVVFKGADSSAVSLKLLAGGVFRIWFSPDGRFEKKNESFAVITDSIEATGNLQVHEQAQAYELFTDLLRIRINRSPFQLQVFDKYQRLLMSDFKERGLEKDAAKVISYKQLRPDEQFIGLGEKAGPLNRRGRTYTMWNSDRPCYTSDEDPLYKSIPFFMSSYQYGIFFDNTHKSVFRFGTESSQYYSFESSGGELLYYFIYGKEYKQILQQYITLTGKPILPPKWAFGFSQSRGLLTNEKLTREIAAGYRSRNIPCDIIYQDIGWVDALQSFDWHPERYQNPAAMLSALDSNGFKVIVSQDPVVSQSNQRQWRAADSLGYFALDQRTGKSYDMPWPWGGNCGVVDFTKPAVANWWGKLQQKPINDGVKGFWTDMGEPAWSNEDAPDRLHMKHFLGMHDEIHNVYGFTWDKVVKEQFEKYNPGKRVFQMTRAAYAGIQRYSFGWSGDSGNGNDVLDGWANLANQIPLALSAGMGGIPFWATDISGYCGDITDYAAMSELYIRWLQFGVFNPLSRAHHEGNNAVEPWLFGAEAEQISKKAIELKYRLFPYIYSYAAETHETGWPLMRAMLLEFPKDTNGYTANEQFMLGQELLVAPVVKKGARSKKIYLPEGKWIDFNNPGKQFDGEQVIEYPAPLDIVPVLVKKGAIIPLMPVMQYIHEKKDFPFTLLVYPPESGQKTSFRLYEDDGETTGYLHKEHSITNISCAVRAGITDLLIQAPVHNNGFKPEGKRSWLIKIQLETKPKQVLLDKKKQKFSWDPATRTCSLQLEYGATDQALEFIK